MFVTRKNALCVRAVLRKAGYALSVVVLAALLVPAIAFAAENADGRDVSDRVDPSASAGAEIDSGADAADEGIHKAPADGALAGDGDAEGMRGLVAQAIATDDTSAASEAEKSAGSAAAITAQDDTSSNTASTAHTPPLAGAQTISWANTAADAKSWFNDEAAVLANGMVEVISVKLPESAGGATMTATDLASANTADAAAYYSKGVLKAPKDAVVTVKISPARDYQLTTSKLNGGLITVTAVTGDANVGRFTFNMPETAEGLALDCGFTKAQDTVVSTNSAITGGSISNAGSVVASGTLRLTVADISDSTKKTTFGNKASSASNVVACVDTKLAGIVNQGSESAAWESAMASTPSAITVTLTLSDAAVSGASQFYIIRESDGNYQQASATYDSSTKSITFKSDKFSSYAIVKGAPPSSTNKSSGASGTSSSSSRSNSSSSSTPKTGDANNPIIPLTTLVASAFVALFAAWRIRRIDSAARVAQASQLLAANCSLRK